MHNTRFIISLLCIILALVVYNSNSLNQLSSDDPIANVGLIKLFNAPNHIFVTAVYKDEYKIPNSEHKKTED